MAKKGLYGLLITGGIIIIVLLVLGFSPKDISNLLFRKPYSEALKEGEYLKITTIWVKGRTISGEYDFEMAIHNPTPRELILKGSWSQDEKRYTLDTKDIDIPIKPGTAEVIQLHLNVIQSTKDGSPVTIMQFKPPLFTGTFLWEKGPSEAKKSVPEEIPVTCALTIRRSFGLTNYLVLAAYLAGMVGIGFLAGRRIKGTKGFFIADGRLNYIIVGLSILGTYLSALTMMGLPGMSYGKHDWTYMVQLPCLMITAIVITGFVLPRYRKAGIVSIYEFLETRIHISARMVASVCFLIFSIGRMGLVLYLPALAFSTVTGAPLWLCIICMGIIITLYTVVGGIEAVIWTDAIQVVIFIAGAVCTLGFIFSNLSVKTFIDIGIEHNKFRMLIPGFDITKITTLWLVMETIFQTIRIYGTQQDVAQRYMTTDSTEKANRSVWIAILSYIPLGFIFYFIGTALFVFYKANPDINLPGKADPIYPYFVVMHLPAGISGLVIAAIFAAAMSSIDSCMNSSSTVCIEDFYKRFATSDHPDRYYLRKARVLTILWGTLAVGMGLLFIGAQYAQIVWGKLMGISTNGILGLMALAFLPFRINKWAAGAGFVLSYVCLFAMMASGVNFLLWPVVGNCTCFFTALFLNPIFSPKT